MENNKTPEVKAKKRKRRHKIFRRILAVILSIIILFTLVTTTMTVISIKTNVNKAKSFENADCTQLKLENYEDGCWNIYTDKELKVLQLTDVHIGGGWMSTKKDSMAINAVAAMVTAEKPDIVIVTGDIAYPVPIQAGTFNNKSGAKIFAELMESLGVYWTLAFGNHDTEAYSYYSREDITEFYSSGNYPHCLLQAGPDSVDGSGNQLINIVNSDGIITRSLFVVDSHSYIDGDYFGIEWKYDNIHNNQIEWYKNSVKGLTEKNNTAILSLDKSVADKYSKNAVVPTSVFLHIPPTEYRDAWNEYVSNGYKDTDNVKLNYGVAGESGLVVYSGIHEDNFFETMSSLNSTDTVFCGHDHLNNFSLNYKGINLTYGMSIDYLAYSGIYKLGSQRGCTVINIATDGKISFSQQNYYQDKYTSTYQKEEVTMQELQK